MLSLLVPLLLVNTARAYDWHFADSPTQCQNVTVNISGDGGKPPYRILVIPYGSTTVTHEVRVIKDIPFDGNANSLSFKMDWPKSSQFVAVVSDASGFGTGGTSIAGIVQDSDDNSCYDDSQNVKPDFYYSIDPTNSLVQCQTTRIYWDKSTVQGTPQYQGVIPGGDSFAIPAGTVTDESGLGTGFDWTVNVRTGSTFLLVGGDDRGNGTAGSTLYTISGGTQNDDSCINSDSPSSTAGSPAGGAYATSTSGGGSGSGSSDDNSGGTNVGAIVGGVVGGVVGALALGLLVLFFHRRKRGNKHAGEKPVDLLVGDEGDEGPGRSELPQYYEPEPFIVPDPTVASDSGRGSFEGGRPPSQVLSDGSAPMTSASRKGPRRELRPVNIIQHDDAGPSEAPHHEEEPETVELPPAYTSVRK
ncbi:hypothetical protein CYLTODRAFT_409501 [Cylindrobasidium torrendii FP15055 ss-10]|uniref:Mid2 domain-containing protein n=1 Tax=Cylindrobasidium torrendii FP15055 ss-10 TaxID=1314674 RepID=A0A0D7BGA7_9AGAR|nr:hypothetical protein CYLTODRAFT_409501 [Cylindrobasidium torrendii FP15055 ss-10]